MLDNLPKLKAKLHNLEREKLDTLRSLQAINREIKETRAKIVIILQERITNKANIEHIIHELNECGFHSEYRRYFRLYIRDNSFTVANFFAMQKATLSSSEFLKVHQYLYNIDENYKLKDIIAYITKEQGNETEEDLKGVAKKYKQLYKQCLKKIALLEDEVNLLRELSSL